MSLTLTIGSPRPDRDLALDVLHHSSSFIAQLSDPGYRPLQVDRFFVTVPVPELAAVLGAAAILFGEQIPEPLDRAMERVVGVTLLILAVYVIVSLVKHRGAAPPRSRWMLVFSGLKRARGRFRAGGRQPIVVIEHDHKHRHNGHDLDDHVHIEAAAAAASAVAVRHSHAHRHVATMPADPFAPAGLRAACAVGMLHGIGAETPTQVLLFAAAADAGGRPASMGLLVCFIVGLLCSNSLIALAAAYGYLGASANRVFTITLSLLTVAFSLVIGALLVTNQSGALPPLLGG